MFVLKHGIAPGYYITFILGGFVQTVGRLCRSHLRPLFLPAVPGAAEKGTSAKKDYDIAGTLASTLILNFTATPFMLGTAAATWTAWTRLNFYGLYMIGGPMAFFYLGGRGWLKGIQTKRVKAATSAPVKPQDTHSPGDGR